MADGSKVGNAYVEVTPKAANDFSSVLERELEGLSEGSGDAKGSLFGAAFSGGMTGAIGAGAVMVGSILADMVETGAQLAMDMVGDAFNGFGEFEQLAGGVEKIFDQADVGVIMADAQAAYADLNMSANEYLASINQVGAAFAQTMGDQAGYDTARTGMIAIADYASGTGRSLSELNDKYSLITRSTSSYQSIADQFSGILPATSADFLEQAQAAGFLSEEYEKLTDVPIAEYQQAVTQMLDKGVADMGLAGNTLAESTETVTGSIAMAKAAWENWLTALGNPDADMTASTDALLDSLDAVADNALPLVERIVTEMADRLPTLIGDLAPVIIPAVSNMLAGVAPAIIEMAPTLVTAGMELVGAAAEGIVDMLPTLAQSVVDGAPAMLGAGMELFGQLGYALGQVGAMIGDAVNYLVGNLPQIVLAAVPLMWEAGLNLFGGFVGGLVGLEPECTQLGTMLAQAVSGGAEDGADASGAAEKFNETFLAMLDVEGVGQEASEGAAAGVDTSAMTEPTMEMVQAAIEGGTSVDASSIGASLSASAAGGIDVGALSDQMSKLSASTTVSIAADTSGADAIAAAAGAVESSYGAMSAAVESAMSAAADSAARAAASVRRAIDIPNKTVSVNVSRGYTVLPHFSMSGTFDAKTGSVPTVNVSWWDKGGLFTQPAIIGVGEGREPEGVFPLSKLEDLMNIEPRGGGGDTYIIEKVEYLPDSEMARYARGMFAEARRLGRM